MQFRGTEYSYTPTVFVQGHLYTPYESPRVKMDSQRNGLIRVDSALAAPVSEICLPFRIPTGEHAQADDEVSRLRRSEEEQDTMDDELLCFITEGSPSGHAAQSKHREAVTAFSGNVEVETLMEHTAPCAVLHVDKEPLTPDAFSLEKFLQA